MSHTGYSEEADFQEKERIFGDLEHWLNLYSSISKPLKALELGGSGGMLSGMFADRWGHVTCTDIVDWNSEYGGEFLKLLLEKFSRNRRAFDLNNIELLRSDAQNLCFRDNWFDVVFSLNAFEHIPDPSAALREAIRVLRPGGLIYLNFDPVWTADSGSHFLHYINEPWAHLIKTDTEIGEIMAKNGATKSEISSYNKAMNRLPAAYYRDNFPELVQQSGASLIQQTSWSGLCNDSFGSHPNLLAAADRLSCPTEDLLIRGYQFVISKDFS